MRKHSRPVAVTDRIETGDACHAVLVYCNSSLFKRNMECFQPVSLCVGCSADAEQCLFTGYLFPLSVRFHCYFPVGERDRSCIQAKSHAQFFTGFLNNAGSIGIQVPGYFCRRLHDFDAGSCHGEISCHFQADDTSAYDAK